MSENPTPAAAATPAVLTDQDLDGIRNHATCGCGIDWPEYFVQGLLTLLDAAVARADAAEKRLGEIYGIAGASVIEDDIPGLRERLLRIERIAMKARHAACCGRTE